MSARRCAHAARVVLFAKGFVPWAHGRSIASAPRGEMKSQDLNESIEVIWFSYDFSKSARAVCFESLGAKTLGFYKFS